MKKKNYAVCTPPISHLEKGLGVSCQHVVDRHAAADTMRDLHPTKNQESDKEEGLVTCSSHRRITSVHGIAKPRTVA